MWTELRPQSSAKLMTRRVGHNLRGSRKLLLPAMLMRTKRTAAHYRLQAARLREFMETGDKDDQLWAVLLDAVERLDRLAAQADAHRRARRAKRKGRSRASLILVDIFSSANGV
jgi:hypothetical protein